MEKPVLLKQGDTIGVCAPSSQFNIKEFEYGVKLLKSLGFKVKVPEEIFNKRRYLAGSDKLRADVVNSLFADKNVNAIICARGGFGAMKILSFLDWDMISKNTKPFIGFSDVTSILLCLMQKTFSPVIHGPNLTSFVSIDEESVRSFYETITCQFKDIKLFKKDIIKKGSNKGILKGGNLSTISHLCGTKFEPEFGNAVLFLEDINEPAYKIDRMLTQMKMADMFEKLQAVVLGSFKGCDDKEYIKEIFCEIFEEKDIPIIKGLNSGHTKKNFSLYMGLEVAIDTYNLSFKWM